MNKKTLKSIGAVIAGFIIVFILSVVTDIILEKTGFFPPQSQPGTYVWWMLLIALIYRSVYSVIGFYLTGLLAPNRPMRHAIILGGIGTVFATLGVMANWDKGAHWYPILLVLVTLPCAWVGGKLAEMKKKK